MLMLLAISSRATPEASSNGSSRSVQPSPTSATPRPPTRVVDENYDEGVADALIIFRHIVLLTTLAWQEMLSRILQQYRLLTVGPTNYSPRPPQHRSSVYSPSPPLPSMPLPFGFWTRVSNASTVIALPPIASLSPQSTALLSFRSR